MLEHFDFELLTQLILKLRNLMRPKMDKAVEKYSKEEQLKLKLPEEFKVEGTIVTIKAI